MTRRRNVEAVPWPSRMRVAVSLSAGSLAVHQLRYLAGHEHGSGRSLGDHGHGYLSVFTPLLGLLLAFAAAHFIWAVCARRPDALAGSPRITVRALAPALLAIHVGQEAMEGWLAFGHPLSATSVLDHGGWIAVPLCLLVGALLAWLSGGARRLAEAVLAGGDELAPTISRALARTPRTGAGKSSAPLARHGAERAPPVLVS